MEWLGAMNMAIDFLEKNINEKLDIEHAAKIAVSSPYHFQRMFHIISGITIAEYVRRRRLTLAAQEILSGAKVIDVALNYGYETPEAFSKAFKKLHGVNPSAAREPGANLKAFPKLFFQITIKGEKDMDYKIIGKDSFKVFGKLKRFKTTTNEEGFTKVPIFLGECVADGSHKWLCDHAGDMGVLGISICHSSDYKDFSYMLAIEDSGKDVREGFEAIVIPSKTWVVFEAIGPIPSAMQELQRRIYSEWLPSTGYQLDEAPEIEVYPNGNVTAPDYRCEFWMAIKK